MNGEGQPGSRSGRAFAVVFGAFLGLALLKFGNPPIFEKWVTVPDDLYLLALTFPWPMAWAWVLVAVVALVGLGSFRWRPSAFKWPMTMLVCWLTWQFVSSLRTVDPALTGPVLFHFLCCATCFFLGCFCLRHDALPSFLIGLIISFILVLAVGFEQRLGGLEQTRRYFFQYLYSQLYQFPPGYLKKMESSRIFSTLFYPNTLAGCLLLLLPAVLVALAQAWRWFTAGARLFLVAGVGLAALACLAWSGSKGGWLLMIGLGLIALLKLPFDRRYKMALVTGVLLLGLTGFTLRYAGFFRKGATSVVARFDYWSAALRTANAHPLTGTGPGTFSRPYAQIKRPESEMARLAHNDYLEQASDSGWPGFLAYSLFLFGVLYQSRGCWPGCGSLKTVPFRSALRAIADPGQKQEVLRFALWLGVLGWAGQGFFEFGLYVPALAWPAFAFLGVLMNSPPFPKAELSNHVDKAKASG